MKKTYIFISIIIAGLILAFYKKEALINAFKIPVKIPTDFEECALKYPVMESYPRRCNVPGGISFVEDIGNALEKTDLIIVSSPIPNEVIENPVVVKGEARGFWYFEASFPIRIFDGNNKEIGLGIAEAKSEWMTEDFVPFETTIFLTETSKTQKGKIILQKDNPSGLPEHDDSLIIPIEFKE